MIAFELLPTAFVALTQTGSAEDPNEVRILWEAPVTCPSRDTVNQRLFADLDQSTRKRILLIDARVTVDRHKRYQVQGELVTLARPNKALRFHYDNLANCEDVLRAVVLFAAITPPPKVRQKWRISVPVAAGFDSGRLDKRKSEIQGQASFKVGTAFQNPHIRLEPSLHYQAGDQWQVNNDILLRFNTIFASMLACYPWTKPSFALHVCTGPELGMVLQIDPPVPNTVQQRPPDPWLAENVAFRFWWMQSPKLAIGIGIEAWVVLGNLQPLKEKEDKNSSAEVSDEPEIQTSQVPQINMRRFGFRSVLSFEWTLSPRNSSRNRFYRSEPIRAQSSPSRRRMSKK